MRFAELLAVPAAALPLAHSGNAILANHRRAASTITGDPTKTYQTMDGAPSLITHMGGQGRDSGRSLLDLLFNMAVATGFCIVSGGREGSGAVYHYFSYSGAGGGSGWEGLRK
ncbi:Uu.00g060720.m01.CDS01 [Anthostomella pinea]|uniref:Uu.00g060720.m01.CDS01 n=1 Tax=Anthostomella pinea TaxID=933095 RepID=A0AAI8YMG0_9PEZI|nr:Uu.00g060720.m01.CDS01 [Anthostomella pinea]